MLSPPVWAFGARPTLKESQRTPTDINLHVVLSVSLCLRGSRSRNPVPIAACPHYILEHPRTQAVMRPDPLYSCIILILSAAALAAQEAGQGAVEVS